MNYLALRWAVEDCRLEGAAKPVLFVIAYRADRDTGECWAGQRRIAREAGVTRTHVQRVMAELLRTGVLEVVESGSGPRPDVVRIVPAWVEGDAGVSGVVEGQAIIGEVIHNPEPSGHVVWPVGGTSGELVATSDPATGHIGDPLVATWSRDSGHSHVPLSSQNAEKGFEGYKQGLEQVRNAAGSAADAAGGVAGGLAAADVVSRILRLDPGAVFDPGTAYSGPTITLSDGSVLPNVRRVHEWLASRESAS